MPTYEKLTLDRFKLNLKEGKYESLTGARRAIGKTTSWTAKERDTAREAADKHFGSSSGPKKAAKVKKPSAKAAPKKAKAAAASKAAAAPKKKAAGAPKKAARPASMTQAVAPSAPGERTKTTFVVSDQRAAASETLSFVREARKELEAFKESNKSLDIEKPQQELFNVLQNSISHMSLATPAASAAPATKEPKAAKPPAAKKTPEPKQETASAVPVPTPSQPEVNGKVGLSDAEQKALATFAGDAGGLGLPPPPSTT